MVLKINVGAGENRMYGYLNIDLKYNGQAYPLGIPGRPIQDESVDEIRASHLLEHFPYRQTLPVLRHWISKLKPGGVLKIAVPDFAWLVDKYLKRAPLPLQAFFMGGQVDEWDFHKAIFDNDSLTQHMIAAGLENIRSWQSDFDDCSAMELSLNLMGTRP